LQVARINDAGCLQKEKHLVINNLIQTEALARALAKAGTNMETV
jgi:hypothetical protein